MSGLQKSLVDRSKNLWGNYHLKLFNEYQEENLNELLEFLEAEEIPFSLGVKLELMLRNKNRVSAAQLVSFDTRYELPKALKEKDFLI